MRNQEEILSKYGINFTGTCFSYGNSKLPRTHMIINFQSAHDCVSRMLGLCKVQHCYAIKCESLYKSYHLKNLFMQDFFQRAKIEDILALVDLYIERSPRKITHIRFNEAGDFTPYTIKIANEIAKHVKKYHIKCYGWTARTDLDNLFAEREFILNASNEGMKNADRKFVCTPRKEFDALPLQLPRLTARCKGNCEICGICYSRSRVHTVMCREH